jgi:hypothetical protein
MNKANNTMLPLVVLSVVLSLCALVAIAARWPNAGTRVVMTQAAAVHHPAGLQTVRVVMHDPGCHWFQTSSGYSRTLTIKGPVNLANFDEAALKIAGAHGTTLDKVLGKVRLARGSYGITMVGQAPDDNHLRLTVS